jgi:hypothetical protein
MQFMQKELSVRMERCGVFGCCRSATVMADSSALLMVCRSSCDLTDIYVVVDCVGSTIAAPIMGFPDVTDPSVYIKASGSHRW